jgi:hypothetical protein
MPLFINDMKAGHAQRKAEPQLSVSSFVSSAHSSDTLTKNSHTVISHSTEIVGKFQELKVHSRDSYKSLGINEGLLNL